MPLPDFSRLPQLPQVLGGGMGGSPLGGMSLPMQPPPPKGPITLPDGSTTMRITDSGMGDPRFMAPQAPTPQGGAVPSWLQSLLPQQAMGANSNAAFQRLAAPGSFNPPQLQRPAPTLPAPARPRLGGLFGGGRFGGGRASIY